MAKKAKRAEVPAAPREQRVNVKVNLTPSADMSVYYSNFIEVSHSTYEFALSVARVPTKLTPEMLSSLEGENATLDVEPTLQVLIPPNVARGLVEALQKQLAAYDLENAAATVSLN